MMLLEPIIKLDHHCSAGGLSSMESGQWDQKPRVWSWKEHPVWYENFLLNITAGVFLQFCTRKLFAGLGTAKLVAICANTVKSAAIEGTSAAICSFKIISQSLYFNLGYLISSNLIS